ncbi:MAG: hypothetical protein ACE5DN_02220 [Flavobacteriales bacterium]
MGASEFSPFYNKPCRFRLKSGKEVFGVIWEDIVNGNKEYFFASSGDYQAYVNSAKTNRSAKRPDPIKLDINDVLDAQQIEI